MTDTINIHEPINEICERLGLVSSNVARLDVTPTSVTAVVMKTNEHGSKYVDETGEIAVETKSYKVRA